MERNYNGKEDAKPVVRCLWATNELSILYHDSEWGVPQHDDRTLFEFLILEGAQAGLSWDTILKKRENYRAAFDNFVPAKVARYDARKVQALMRDHGNRSQPAEDRVCDFQCARVSRGAEGVRVVRPVRVAICWRRAARQ